MQMNDLTFFFRTLKGRCHGNQFWAKLFIALAFQNELENHKNDLRGLNSNDPCTSGRNLVSFHLVIPEFARLKCLGLYDRRRLLCSWCGCIARPGGL